MKCCFIMSDAIRIWYRVQELKEWTDIRMCECVIPIRCAYAFRSPKNKIYRFVSAVRQFVNQNCAERQTVSICSSR
jgi:hypothetical protein